MEKENLVIYCDGGSRGNPGPAASAFVAIDKNTIIHKESKFLGNETNNVAEYTAVLLAVSWLSKNLIFNHRYLIINLDSQLVERQLNKKYKIKNKNLKSIYDKIELLISNHKLKINFVWNYRDKNHLADSLVNKELDQRENF
ncbi:hypothetical protein A2130_04350 [Candidatus Woesebacteria bacterium GWC2_33_12]|uniref:Ribonuclease HI n=1 Tax=Candidatus Woesebacteria bacterium GW2011_GWB1_33_22 TaxID=1618566 RepID=A0A0G0BZH5_9BACT|nr:MAG: Ribonuclease HI [Candidatus Woesebacteria bacterium GW2011_GWC2_33_12]KKP41827.1 MAG: Ribonuclease HI [Candidatus Woesebacteria bacterium GW2011_GWA2_33_20]KKP44315.1 MAG: Ribonuclease HI [Candidatus Woesebacteria bacterium GW2011_GWB1_33_22]KKP46073.1 MAG: Ribonuclease HI [Microgenomates group bacterium GW2011_GWC1_33_28]KKP49963.1 MAG: Ribonuclease HI [Candidatus Woesebacteria bacterium GW2011_GWA1_33_33]OGM07021.1 MAG: hypothetical protein A2130_04350 [Candidatus Woesebacteria bacte